MNDVEKNFQREMYIFGEVQDFDIGNKKTVKIRFLTYKEYLMNMSHLSLISMNTLHIYHQYRKILKNESAEVLDEIEALKRESLYNIVSRSPDLIDSYLRILALKLDIYEEQEVEEFITLIFSDEAVFMKARELIMDTEMLVESEVSPNPEVQKGIEISRNLKSQNNKNAPGIADVLTSIVTGTAISFEDLQDMTAIQVNSVYQRIGAFKEYDTTTLFATVSSDVNIESWGRKIDLYEKTSSSIAKQEFDKNYGKLMN